MEHKEELIKPIKLITFESGSFDNLKKEMKTIRKVHHKITIGSIFKEILKEIKG